MQMTLHTLLSLQAMSAQTITVHPSIKQNTKHSQSHQIDCTDCSALHQAQSLVTAHTYLCGNRCCNILSIVHRQNLEEGMLPMV